MTSVNTNINSIVSQRVLGLQNAGLANSLERLSTGLRINRGKDDPSGLIASENLRAEKTAITQAITNGERAENIISIAEGGLTEIQDQLNNLEGLVDSAASSAGLSDEEKEAIQLQIDGILGSIDRVADQTSFQGVKLLNGNFEFLTSGVTSSELSEVSVNAALFAAIDSNGNSGSISLTVTVGNSAQTALSFLSVGQNGAGTAAFSGQTATFEFTGANGTVQLSFASGTTAADAVTSINNNTELTGVSASTSGDGIVLRSTDVGSDNFVSVRFIEGSAYESRIHTDNGTGTAINTTGASSGTDSGRDADILINGIAANVRGLEASISQPNLDVKVTVADAFNTRGSASNFSITGGGARFNLGPQSELASKVGIGLNAVTTGTLGSAGNGRLAALKSGGTANVLNGDVDRAQKIVRDAIGKVSTQRGHLGSFISNTVRTSINAMGIAFENTAAAESAIRDTDFAEETAELTRRQILVQAATNTLAISNAQPQNALALLG